MRHLLVVISILGLSACAMLSRDPRTGYANDKDYSGGGPDEFYRERMNKRESDAREELGYSNRPLTDAESARLTERLRLNRLESQLESSRDQKQYYGSRNFMRSDQERIAFLQLPNFETKQRWLQNRGLLKDNEVHSPSTAKVIEANDIMLGMNEKAVRESWGDPDAVEVAGNPMYGYQRWNYHRMTPGNDGYQKELRVIYFEGGRVVGWETPN